MFQRPAGVHTDFRVKYNDRRILKFKKKKKNDLKIVLSIARQ